MTEKKQKRTRTVDNKIKLAESGDIGCKFEVIQWLKDGRYSLEKNIEKADEYLVDIKDVISNERPYFYSLDLVNFKGIKSIHGKIELDPYLNVFVGINGSGKTTIIEAFKKASSWIVNGIRSKASGRSIQLDEINKDHFSKESFLIADLKIGENSDFQLLLHKSKLSHITTSTSLAEYKNLSSIYSIMDELDSNTALPVFAHYSVSRALEIVHNKIDAKEIPHPSKLQAYELPFEDSKNYKQLLEWLAFYNEKDGNGISSDGELESKKGELKKVREILASLPENVSSELVDMLEMDLAKLIKDIAVIEINNRVESKVVTVVKEAISKFMNISNIRIDVNDETMTILIDKDDITISALDLSHGEKALFSLVSDLAKKLVQLNPDDNLNPLEGFGVVTIDEIDLHLHPSWQQEIVLKLREVFPNIQFILTTHSPQVLSTVPNTSIRILERDRSGIVKITQPKFSLGFESSSMLEDVFMTSSRPQNVDIVQDLNEYKNLVIEDKWDTDRAKELEAKLGSFYGDHDFVIRKLKTDIRLRERRRK
ncbi:AAA family ATPase [Vibrio cholerae]|nr:AAA family ATPase [Vibrio cholerae]ELJ8517118.1 AAA family ATPase [Vibrio cholerae]